MPKIDGEIDELYQTPLEDFVAARGALAKAIGGAEGARVRKLPKPTLVPWAVNQVYWKARRVYDRLLASGERLRKAQIAALEGRAADVRAATSAHRDAVAEAVERAEHLASGAGSHPAADALTRTFEALSLAPKPSEPHGRLTKPLQPLGFEALTGVTPKPAHHASAASGGSVGNSRQAAPTAGRDRFEVGHPVDRRSAPSGLHVVARSERDHLERQRARNLAAAARERERRLTKAETALKRAQAAEAKARHEWERRKSDVDRARTAISAVRDT